MVKNAQGPGLDAHMHEALSRCSELAAAAVAGAHPSASPRSSRRIRRATASSVPTRRQTVSSVRWKACPSVHGGDGSYAELMTHVEAILDSATLSYIVPRDLAQYLHDHS